jgi:hypothetical protein
MKLYNLYYKNIKINGFPVSAKVVNEVIHQDKKSISKMQNGQLIEIPINKIDIVQVTIV